MTKILLIGQGQIGRGLVKALSKQSLQIWDRDIDDLTREVLDSLAVNVVINAAGKTNLAWCEANAAEALRSNLEAPVRLYDRILALAVPPRFIHFSSGCVWDGPYDETGKPFTPDSPTSPAALYSWTKAACDAMLLERDPKHVSIVRPRQVYSGEDNGRNMLVKLMRYPALIDTPNSVSSMSTIAKAIEHLLTAQDWTGVWNVYDRGVVTPYQIGKMLSNAGLREQPALLSKEELDTFHRPRRVDTVLYDARFEATVAAESAEVELLRAIEGLKEHVEAEAA